MNPPSVKTITQYLDEGGDPNMYMGTPSLRFNVRKLVELFLSRGADPNFQMAGFVTPLIGAVRIDASEPWKVQMLLDHGADVTHMCEYRGNALHTLVWYPENRYFKEKLDILMKYGADINALDAQGRTPFDRMLGIEFNRNWYRAAKEMLKHRPRFKYHSQLKKRCPQAFRMWVRRKWMVVRCVVKFLSLHQRAVVTANNPLRKLARGEFVL